MGDKVQHSDLIQDPLFEPTTTEAKALVVVLNEVNKQLREFVGASKDAAKANPMQSYADVEKIIKGYEETKTATDALAKSKKDLAAAEEVYTKALQGEVNEVVQNKEDIKILNAETRRLARERSALGSTYDKESARLNNLRRKYKDLAVQNEHNTEAGKALLKQVQELDGKLKDIDATVGQHQRNVGNYQSALEGLPGPLGQAADGVKGLGEQFLKLLKNPVVLVIAGIVFILKKLFDAFVSTDEGGKQFAVIMEQISAVMDVLRQRFAAFANGIINFFKGNWKQAADDFSQSFTGIGEQIESATKAAKEYVLALDELEDAEIGYISRRAQDANKIAKLEFLAADRTKSIEERRKALEEAIKLSEEEVAKEKSFAEQRLEIELKKQAGLLNISKQSLKEFIAADDVRQKELLENDKELARARNMMNDDGQKALEEAYAKVIDTDTRFFEENKRNNAKLTALMEEENDRRTKAAEDAFKAEMLLEKLRIEAMREGLDKQLAMLAHNYKQEQHELKGNKKALIELEKIYLMQRQQLIDDFDKKRLEAEQRVQDLLFELKATELGKQLKQLEDQARKEEEQLEKDLENKLITFEEYNKGVDAIRKKRSNAEIKLLKDQADRERNARIESIHQEEQLQEALLDQKRNQFKSEKDWELYKQQELAKIKKKAIEAELKELENVQTKEAELRREQLKAQLVDLQVQQEKINQEIFKKQVEQVEKIAQFVDGIQEKRTQKRLKAIDKELDANKKRQDELRQLAIQGNKTAQESLAEEEKKQAELEQKREKELAKAKRRELGLAAINTYTAKVQAGDKNALGSTIRDLTLLGQAIGSIPGFMKGTEMVEDDLGSPHLPGRDGYIVRVDGKERILDPEQNSRIGDMSNEDLTVLAEQYRKGLLTNISGVPVFSPASDTRSLGELMRIGQKLESIEENTAMITSHEFYYKHLEGALIETIKSKNKVTRNHYKTRSL